MSLTNALFSSVSGLETASTAISVIGDNIANANTPGFKEKRAEFSAVLGQSITSGAGFSQIGAGARVNDVGTIFSQGVFETTQRNTDLGIEGRGFFVLQNQTGRSYTRSGIFGFDSTGLLVDSNQNRVQGYGINAATGQSNGVLGDIQVNLPLSPPQPSSLIQLAMNLDANETAIPAGGPSPPSVFDPANAEVTSNFREVVTVYDSLGSARDATVFFSKVGANQWEFNVTLPDGDSGARTGEPFVLQAGGTGLLTFNTVGELESINPLGGGPGNVDPTITFAFDTSNGAAASQDISFGLGPVTTPGGLQTGAVTTQFNRPTVTNTASQDGFSSGTLTALNIDNDGTLVGVFSNGETTPLARIALANFGNVEGLTEIGGSRLIESIESGAPIIAAANSGNLGSIRSSSFEKSNVDLPKQFVNLIVSQRAFQANTRTVSVTNELLANLVQLGQ